MFALQERLAHHLLGSLKHGQEIGEDSQRLLDSLASVSRRNPVAPLPVIVEWYQHSVERVRRQQHGHRHHTNSAMPPLNILNITAVILTTICAKAAVFYGEDCDELSLESIAALFQFHGLALHACIENGPLLMKTARKLTAGIAHMAFELFIEHVRSLLTSPSLKPVLHETLIVALSEVKLAIHSEPAFAMSVRFLHVLARPFNDVHGPRLKEAYCATLGSLLSPLIPVIGAESNVPSWASIVETTLFARARALFAKPRYSQVSRASDALCCV